MVKMEFLKRKHFSLWIIATLFLLLSDNLLDGTLALQGVPTWICLGVKSPFIEFSNDLEVLANNSIPLNITKDEQALMHQEGLRKLGTFIKPVDLRDSTTGFVKANLTKKIPTSTTSRRGAQMHRRINPIQEEMDQKQIILLDEDTDENGLPASLTDEDRKFIVPMALKNASPDPRIPITTPRTTTARTTAAATTRRMTTPATPEFASNIDDLKKHILFLQNLTKHDSNFQSKFVVFPSLQKDKQKPAVTAAVSSTTVRPQRPIFPYSAPIPPPTRRVPVESKVPPFGGYYHNEEEPDMSLFLQPTDKNARDKITIVPQVLLLNDHKTKAYDNDVNLENVSLGNRGRTRINVDRPTMSNSMPSSTTTTTSSTTTETTTTTRRITRPTKLPACIRNPDSPKCIRQRKREELQRMRDREQLLREQEEYLRPHYEPYMQTLNNTKRFAVSIEIPDSFKIPLNESGATQESYITSAEVSDLQILSRAKRSPSHKRRNIGGGVPGRSATGTQDKFSAKYGGSSIGYFERDAIMTSAAVSNTGGRDFLFTNVDQYNGMGVLPNNTNSNVSIPGSYSEPIDLNPDNCYLVEGMTYGQKKQCALHTSVMPAISRGARATIQECQYQFKNRRWNCSTTDDNTVFGPMTGLGSPEMAFIHALAAATVTSFIARACRDGQLASCGCSRGSRPKQLHDDWTWGGCGDNLEFAYKFATDFIDIREKETRRGTRGVGHPERKRGRFHEQQRKKMQQMMQADDASAAYGLTSDGINVTTKQQKSTGTFAEKEHINGGKKNQQQKQQQQLTNKTVNTDSVNINNNNNNDDNINATMLSNSKGNSKAIKTLTSTTSTTTTITTTTTTTPATTTTTTASPNTIRTISKRTSSVAPQRQEFDSSEEYNGRSNGGARIKPEDLLELQERITKEILNSKLQEKEMLKLQENINREILNSKVFNLDNGSGNGGGAGRRKKKRKNQRAVNGLGNTLMADASSNNNNNNNNNNMGMSSSGGGGGTTTTTTANNNKWKNGISAKARSLMNLHNNEAGRRAVIKKTRITCKCHGVSGSCSLITCWQQLSSIREIGDYLREKYEESTEVKLNKRGRLQVKDAQYKVPTAHDLVYMDESPDWCRNNRQLQWSGTHGRICNKTSAGLDGCGILCCGRGYNTKNIVVRERCNCKFHWCCQVKCDVCVKVLEEHTCK